MTASALSARPYGGLELTHANGGCRQEICLWVRSTTSHVDAPGAVVATTGNGHARRLLVEAA
jgi:hypothetical protein